MNIRFATDAEVSTWNKLILANPDGGNIFQSAEFADQKASANWMPRYVMCDDVAVLILERYIIGLGKIWYAPKAPGVTTDAQLINIIASLRSFAKENGVFVLKVESEIIKSPLVERKLSKKGYLSVRAVQPNNATVILDISKPLDAVIADLPQKGRHAIRRAERDGVEIKAVDATDENCRQMFELMRETSTGRFAMRDFQYYRTYWQRFAAADMGRFYFAYFDGQLVAAAYIMVFGEKATYKDGASIRAKTAYGASHFLQWTAIEWAKSKGAKVYDMCGTPPPDRINDPTHPFYGIGRFKTSFNKEVTEFIGTYDIPVKPLAYKLWQRAGWRIVSAYYSRVLNKFFY